MGESIIRFENVSKQYRLGMIGSTTLREDLQRLGARMRHQEDPTKKIGRSQLNQSLKIGDTFWALQDINLDIEKGETLGIIGRNGAGKSTLLKLLCRITAPTAGTISYNGRIASMLEVGTGFHGELTGRENIYLNGAILGMSRREVASKIDDIIEFSECGQFIDTPVKRYSSGMYVKLAFSVAAFLDAEIMIMDEVLAVGDVAFHKKCISRMKELAKQEHRTVLYVSHLLPTVSELCNRCIVMDHGHIVYDGATPDAISHYLENDVETATSIDYTDTVMKRKPWRHAVQLLRASFPGKNNAIFHDEEPIRIRLDFKYLEDSEGISFRLDLRAPDGRPIATSLKERFLSGKSGQEASIVLEYDLPELTQGRYQTVFTFLYSVEGNAGIGLESREGLSFEKKYSSLIDPRWDSSKLGNIRLAPPKVV
ncbi:MAG: ATP-binding cassette domain-containing protein [Clostridiales bacterium]|nr:ATP-binding cassette domain-containing protein [Clostridiales bacterium]